MQIGIVGLPNVGKSTLFTALTKKSVGVSNYPFTTIDPNVGVVAIPDERLERLAAMSRSEKVVPATIEFVDIAGLVRGANKGEGLGNQFLANIREVDAIVEVVRAFENPEIIHVEGEPNPWRDHEIIETELILKDLETIEKRLERAEKEAKTGEKEALARREAVRLIHEALTSGDPARCVTNRTALEEARLLSLLTAKPLLALLNATNLSLIEKEREFFETKGIAALTFNFKEELEASSFSIREREELDLSEPALSILIRTAYNLLGLCSFLTTGPKESRAWTIEKGTKAPQAAGVIHSDFENKFIRMDVIQWNVLLEAGGYTEARSKGLIRSEGKDYIVQDGDVVDVKHG